MTIHIGDDMKEDEFLEIKAKIANLNALTEKYHAERIKTTSEDKYYPFIVSGSVILTIIALVKLFL